MPRRSEARQPVEAAVYSIPQFCEAHNISRATYYNLRDAGQGPEEAHLLGRVVITHEAAAAWRKARTEASRGATQKRGKYPRVKRS